MNLSLNLSLADWGDSLEKMAKRLQNMSPAMRVGKIAAVGEVKERFNTSTDPKGQPWLTLKEPRVRTKGIDLPLLDTGKLRASITGDYGKDWLSTGTPYMPIASTQQFGKTILPKHGNWMTIPLTRKALLAGSARRFEGKLHRRVVLGELFLVDNKDELHYRLVKKVIIPPRPFVGVSQKWISWFSKMLIDWISTGRFESYSE